MFSIDKSIHTQNKILFIKHDYFIELTKYLDDFKFLVGCDKYLKLIKSNENIWLNEQHF